VSFVRDVDGAQGFATHLSCCRRPSFTLLEEHRMQDESTLKNGTPTSSDAAGINSLKDEWTKARRAVNQAATKAEVTGKAKRTMRRSAARAK
jgi:hypothetical protein